MESRGTMYSDITLKMKPIFAANLSSLAFKIMRVHIPHLFTRNGPPPCHVPHRSKNKKKIGIFESGA